MKQFAPKIFIATFNESEQPQLQNAFLKVVMTGPELNSTFLRWWFYQHGRLCAKVHLVTHLSSFMK
jgi:hypothetical protein